jgi:hypothetical protein
MATDEKVRYDSACLEVIPHCVGLMMSDKTWDKLQSGADDVCLPRDYDGPRCCIESLRSLFACYLYLVKWGNWKPVLVSHGCLVKDVLDVLVGEDDYCAVGKLGLGVVRFHPDLEDVNVLCLVHPSFVNRSLPDVRTVPNHLDYRARCRRWNIQERVFILHELEAASKGRWTLGSVDYLYTAKTDIITVYEDKAVVAIQLD